MKINGEEHNDLCIGIDLGTTNSVLAFINLKANGDINSKVASIKRAVDATTIGKFTEKKEPTLPSCVYYNEEKDFATVVGNYAKKLYPSYPHLVAKSIKSRMGNATADGLSPEVPDKTPAEISARILKHMLTNAAKDLRQIQIDDAVITVPASFDSIMCQATLKAAEIAGINIYKKDGSIRSILLPEPQAVIYDFINQVHNGDIPAQILDLSTEKNVMVFDLGGGTLDVTLHKISRRKDAPEVLSVEDLAINRYTLLGGDDFDKALAEEMFKRYLKQWSSDSQKIQAIKRNEHGVMNKLVEEAEALKIEISMNKSGLLGERSDILSAWGEDEDTYPVNINISTGYPYNDEFTAEEVERVFQKFMGTNLTFNDFKKLDEISAADDTNNIIFPILDVLKKCADKLGTDNVKVDAVIMNGGMSKLYMILDRLKEFFGFEPITALDPDQSVARGAAVYHYFLHKYAAALANQTAEWLPKNLDDYNQKIYHDEPISDNKNIVDEVQPPLIPIIPAKPSGLYISPIKFILPDSLYLVAADNYYEEIIQTGTQLPHQSAKFTGFKLQKGTSQIKIPIARRDIKGNYKVIARGSISFPAKYAESKDTNFVTFTIHMNEQKIIHMDAYICSDSRGLNVLDKGTAEIVIDTGINKTLPKNSASTVKNIPAFDPSKKISSFVNPVFTLNNILDFCKKVENAQRNADSQSVRNYSDLIRREKLKIFAATNHADFAEPLLKSFRENDNVELYKMNCAIIGRKIGLSWSDSQKRRFANLCLDQVAREMNHFGMPLKGSAVNTKIQSIYALYMCASEEDLEQMVGLHSYDKFRIANLYVHAMTKTSVDWIYSCFKQDWSKTDRGLKSNIQVSAHALGLAYRLSDGKAVVASVMKETIVEELCDMIRSKKMDGVEISNCIIALGLLCDRRYPNSLKEKVSIKAQVFLESLRSLYQPVLYVGFEKAVDVALKMMEGEKLSDAEEEFLLIKLDD